MAPLLTVSADIVYDLLQRGDLLGRKVGRKWLTTKTAVLKWLEQSATPHPTAAQETALAHASAHGDTAALVDAVCTGKARLGTKVQHAARSGRVPGGDQACQRAQSPTGLTAFAHPRLRFLPYATGSGAPRDSPLSTSIDHFNARHQRAPYPRGRRGYMRAGVRLPLSTVAIGNRHCVPVRVPL